MRKLLCLFLLASPLAARAQSSPVIGGPISTVATDPSGSVPCNLPWQYNLVNGHAWYPGAGTAGVCTWTQIGSGSSSGVSSFNTRTGAVTLTAGDVNAVGAITNPTSGNAGTSTALAATPTLCSTGQAPTGVLANGNATGCAAVSAPAALSGLQGTIQAEYVAYLDGSGTTLHDQSGNSYNCTIQTGATQPTWNTLKNGLVFSFPVQGLSYLTCPAASISGATGIQVFMQPTIPNTDDPAIDNTTYILADSNNNGPGIYQVRNGEISFSESNNETITPVEKTTGNVDWAITCTTPATIYLNGGASQGYLYSANCPTFNGAGNMEIGTAASNGIFNFSGTIYAIIIYSTTSPTAAQIQNNHAVMSSLLAQNGIAAFGNPPPSSLYLWEGDSRTANSANGGYAMTNSRSYLISQLGAGRESYWNIAIPGETLATIVTTAHLNALEYPILKTASASPAKTIMLDAGVNDCNAGSTGASVYANIQSYCSTMHGAAKGSKIIASTVYGATELTSTKETCRETVNSDMIAGAIAGTFSCDGVDDNANDPIMATQVVPNNYNPSGTPSFNSTWYNGGLHATAAAQVEMATQENFALLAAQGRAAQCTVIRKQVPYQVITAANAATGSTTQTVTLLQLFPGWQVCSLTANVKTAFTGTTTLTMSIGDSGGSATTYVAASSLTSTGSAFTPVLPIYVSSSGIVQMNFTSTVSNLTALTAGEVDIDIGVVVNP